MVRGRRSTACSTCCRGPLRFVPCRAVCRTGPAQTAQIKSLDGHFCGWTLSRPRRSEGSGGKWVLWRNLIFSKEPRRRRTRRYRRAKYPVSTHHGSELASSAHPSHIDPFARTLLSLDREARARPDQGRATDLHSESRPSHRLVATVTLTVAHAAVCGALLRARETRVTEARVVTQHHREPGTRRFARLFVRKRKIRRLSISSLPAELPRYPRSLPRANQRD